MTANRMFPFYVHNTIHSCFSTKLKDTAWLWHFHYGHLNFGGLKTLQQKHMVTGLPQISAPSQVCEECVVSRQHQNQFSQGKSWRAKQALELIHSHICGPTNPSSNGDESVSEMVPPRPRMEPLPREHAHYCPRSTKENIISGLKT